MIRTWIAWLLFLLLVGVAGGMIWYKADRLAYPLLPNHTVKSWYVEVHSQLRSSDQYIERLRRSNDAVGFKMTLPTDSDRFAVAGVQTIANGFGVQTTRKGENRYRSFAKRDAKPTETVYLRFMLYALDANAAPGSDEENYKQSEFAPSERIPNPNTETQALYDTIDEAISETRDRSSGPSSFLIELARYLENDPAKRDYLIARTRSLDLTALLTKLTRAAGYAARSANGVVLHDQVRDADIYRWVEIVGKNKEAWRAFDPNSGDFDLPEDAYRWWTGDTPFVYADNVEHISNSIFLKSNRDGAFTRALWRSQEQQPWIYKLSPQTLPLDQQLVLQILLLLPIGAVFVAFFRQVIGFRTFGTFMPVLIALAFRETGALYGVMFFAALISVGFIMRGYLDRLRLLLVPRLSAVLTFVILVIAAFMVLTKDLSLPLGLSVALFPVVIITMFIERLSTVWEELGSKEALLASLGTMAIAAIIYSLIINDFVRHFVFTFPETLLAVFGFCLILGRYNGYKVTEYFRFWQLRNAIKAEREKNGGEA